MHLMLNNPEYDSKMTLALFILKEDWCVLLYESIHFTTLVHSFLNPWFFIRCIDISSFAAVIPTCIFNPHLSYYVLTLPLSSLPQNICSHLHCLLPSSILTSYSRSTTLSLAMFSKNVMNSYSSLMSFTNNQLNTLANVLYILPEPLCCHGRPVTDWVSPHIQSCGETHCPSTPFWLLFCFCFLFSFLKTAMLFTPLMLASKWQCTYQG